MADSKKEEGREDDDLPFDYTDSKKEEAGHDDEEEAGLMILIIHSIAPIPRKKRGVMMK